MNVLENKVNNDLDTSTWTYGAEHEFSDWDARKGVPKGFNRAPDYTIVNSNTIASHPDINIYHLGGEFNTPPTSTPEGQADALHTILEMHPNCTINHRSNLHIHVRIPGLKDNLTLLKKIQLFIHTQLPLVIDKIEPIPMGLTDAERKREKRRYISHHKFLSKDRVAKQLKATTPQEFFESEVSKGLDGRLLWHLSSRVCVNIRQILQTDTIEFRHFPGTLDEKELLTSVNWCRDFLKYAILGKPIKSLSESYLKDGFPFPKFPKYNLELEIGYQATCKHGKFSMSEVKDNIRMILDNKFIGSDAHKRATNLARGIES